MKNLLWIDCTAGALAAAVVLLFSGKLSHWHALPREIMLFIGAVNLLYAGYSFSLARRTHRPKLMVNILVFANGIWAAVCLGIAMTYAGTASLFGMVHLVGEAIFVGGLAGLEWKWREQLLTA